MLNDKKMRKTIRLIWGALLLISLFTERISAQNALNPCDAPSAIADELTNHSGMQIHLSDPDKVKAFINLYSSPTLRRSADWLETVKDWQKVGLVVKDKGNGIFDIMHGTNPIGSIDNGVLLSKSYASGFSTSNPIGPIINECQVFQDGSRFIIKRLPPTTGLSSVEVAYLQRNSRSHTLERHGPGVTDESLIIRASSGLTPDGQSNNIVNATKFDSNNEIQYLIQNYGPGTPNFNNKLASSSNPNQVIFDKAPSAIPLGCGFRIQTNIKVCGIQQFSLVWVKDSTGWYILTMYPFLP